MIPFRQLVRDQKVETGWFIWCGNHEFREVIHIEDSLTENTKGGDEREEIKCWKRISRRNKAKIRSKH